jgi:uncharacterized membrane protein
VNDVAVLLRRPRTWAVVAAETAAVVWVMPMVTERLVRVMVRLSERSADRPVVEERHAPDNPTVAPGIST